MSLNNIWEDTRKMLEEYDKDYADHPEKFKNCTLVDGPYNGAEIAVRNDETRVHICAREVMSITNYYYEREDTNDNQLKYAGEETINESLTDLI